VFDTDLLTDVWGSGPNDVYAVGVDFVTNTNIALHWDGAAWAVIEGITSGDHVTGSGPNDVWISGATGVSRFDGTSWSRVFALEGLSIKSLSVAAPGDVWMITDPQGFAGVWHLDATGFFVSLQFGDPLSSMESVHASSSQDVWVVGDSFVSDGSRGLVFHYDGQTGLRGPDAQTPLLDVTNVTGLGTLAVGPQGGMVQLAAEPAPTFSNLRSGSSLELAGVFGSAPTDMWAVGDFGVALHYDGRTVANVPPGTLADLMDVWGTGPADVWAVGAAGTVVHFDGQSFAPVAAGSTVDLKAVFTARPDDVWIGGDGGTLLHWNGSSMTPVAVPGLGAELSVLDLHGVAADDIWLSGGAIVGSPPASRGFVSHFDGQAWSPVEVLTFSVAGISEQVRRIWQLAPDDVWAAVGQLSLRGGGPDAYWHFDGTAWTERLVDQQSGQSVETFVFPNRERPSFVFGPHDRWRADFFGIWQRNTM
jgi:hypothetical protein